MTGYGSGLDDKVGIPQKLGSMILEVSPNLTNSVILFPEHLSPKEELWSQEAPTVCT